MNRSEATRKLVTTAVLMAMVFALGWPGSPLRIIGFIQISPLPFSITTLHAIVILGAILEGPLVGSILGAAFGFLSFFSALTYPELTAIVFINPVISVLPRIGIGLVAASVYRICIHRMSQTVSGVFAAILGTITNTLFVLGFLYLFSFFITDYKTFLPVFGLTLIVNFLLEIVVAIVVVTTAAKPLKILYRRLGWTKGE